MKKILRRITVPTGDICIIDGDHGKLEFLSIGDYGKEKNVKADFLGLTDEIHGVPHGNLLPLEEKWVVTISSQYGCSMGCTFCDVPKVGSGRNATVNDIYLQVEQAIYLHPEVKYTDRLNIHVARMGEPTFNKNVITAIKGLCHIIPSVFHWHPVVSTMMPKANMQLEKFLTDWMNIKNIQQKGEAGLQLSINSTDNVSRNEMFRNSSLSLEKISEVMRKVLDKTGLIGRKIALNFAVHDNSIINGEKLRNLFDPRMFMCKITPMHMTNSCRSKNIITNSGYEYYHPYKEYEKELKDAGFDVIVFIPSREEDESRITCGNAILSLEKGL